MKPSIALLGLATSALLVFPSCTNYPVSLTYTPPAQGQRVMRGHPVVDVGKVTDLRDKRGKEIGAVRNEVGIPIKVLYAKKPVAEITHNAFAYALDVRGMLAKRNPRYIISAEILELWAHQYTSQDAGCRMRISVFSKGNSRPRFSKVYAAKRSRPSPNLTYWSKVDEVAKVTSDALQAVIDGALDDPDLRRAMR